MVEYLPRSGTKCLDYQPNDKQNCKSGTPVAIPNLSLPPVAEPPIKYLFSTPTEESVPYSVSVSATNHSKKLLTMIVNTSTGGPRDCYGLYSPFLDAPTTSATTGIPNSLSWEVTVQSTS